MSEARIPGGQGSITGPWRMQSPLMSIVHWLIMTPWPVPSHIALFDLLTISPHLLLMKFQSLTLTSTSGRLVVKTLLQDKEKMLPLPGKL